MATRIILKWAQGRNEFRSEFRDEFGNECKNEFWDGATMDIIVVVVVMVVLVIMKHKAGGKSG